VTGTPRSGKSCLAHRLERAPELHLLPEPLPIWNIGFRSRTDDRRTAEEATDRVRHDIVAACARVLSRAGKSRYLDDLAYHALRIPFVHRVVPDAKIIHVIRDPEQVIPEIAYWWSRESPGWGASLARGRRHFQVRTLPHLALRYLRNRLHTRRYGRAAIWGPCVPGLPEFAAGHGPAEIAAYQWQGMVEFALDDLARLPRDAWLEVRFERLIADPGGEMARVAGFCELEDPKPIVEYARSIIDPDWPNPYVAELSASEWDAVKGRVTPLRRRLGYA
jgi:hypothetical protein